ncbi:MAG TPA: GTPase Era [bacterium]|jgi:GTP-binding protein Era|nr:GTPase Era [bacterium]
MAHRSGFVALAGRPNVGKSTLLNRLLGTKVAAVSPVPQTTRTVIRGILTRPDAQIVFLDLPGLHAPRHRLGEVMVDAARRALGEVDLVAWIVEAGALPGPEERIAAEALRGAPVPILLVVNKLDRATPAGAETTARAAASLVPVTETVMVSAQTGAGLPDLVDRIIARLPEGPAYYPEDMVTDQPEQFLVREIIREHAIHLTRQELPHALAVEIEEFAERPRGLTYVRATLHVEKPSQRKIVIGHGGQRLRAIGAAARAGAEALLGRKVYLDLWVTVTPDWREKPALIRGFYPE